MTTLTEKQNKPSSVRAPLKIIRLVHSDENHCIPLVSAYVSMPVNLQNYTHTHTHLEEQKCRGGVNDLVLTQTTKYTH